MIIESNHSIQEGGIYLWKPYGATLGQIDASKKRPDGPVSIFRNGGESYIFSDESAFGKIVVLPNGMTVWDKFTYSTQQWTSGKEK